MLKFKLFFGEEVQEGQKTQHFAEVSEAGVSMNDEYPVPNVFAFKSTDPRKSIDFTSCLGAKAHTIMGTLDVKRGAWFPVNENGKKVTLKKIE